MKIKICGLRDPKDARLALDLGATHLGCVFAKDSPRSTSPSERRAIRELCRDRATFVLVVRGETLESVRALAASLEPDLVQWHGVTEVEEEGLLETLPLLRVRTVGALAAHLPATDAATAWRPFLLDGGRGGTGERFAWALLAQAAPSHTFVAGGITPDLLPTLLPHRPWGIDVSSGVESAPGCKDATLLRSLFANLETAP